MMNETNIYSKRKNICFGGREDGKGFGGNQLIITGSKPGIIFTMLRDTDGIKPNEGANDCLSHLTLSEHARKYRPVCPNKIRHSSHRCNTESLTFNNLT